jgi:hypothetical protein
VRALAIFWLAASCALAGKITAESDHAADFARYKTFAIRDGELNTSGGHRERLDGAGTADGFRKIRFGRALLHCDGR